MKSLTFGLSLSFFSFVRASALAFGSGFILSYLSKKLQPGGSLHAFLPVRQARRPPPRRLPPPKKDNLQDAHSLCLLIERILSLIDRKKLPACFACIDGRSPDERW